MPCKKVGFCFLMLFLVGLLFCKVTFSQPVSDKRGGICFRIDDNQPIDKLQQVDSIFSKYGLKFCTAIISDDLSLFPDLVTYLKLLIMEGHEVMDQTSSHQTQFFTLMNLQDTTLYKGVPGVDHLTGNKVCLTYLKADTSRSHNEGLVDIEGNMLISQKPGEFKDIGTYIGVFLNTLNKVCLWYDVSESNPADPDTLFVRSFWAEEVILPSGTGIRYHKLTRNDVTMTPEAIQQLGKRTLKIFSDLGIPRPYTWIHPGGRMPYIPADQLKANLGDLLGYRCAASYDYPTYICFDEYNPSGIKPFGMQYGEASIEYNTFKWNKNIISDFIAKHYVQIDLSHFTNPYGGWDAMLKRMDSLLYWCSYNNIPVKTQLDWKANLYDYTPNGALNSFPALNIDLNDDSYPDGYLRDPNFKGKFSKSDGVPESGGCCFEINSTGDICYLSRTAGLEKGKNAFSIWTKGTNGKKATVKIRLTFPETGQSGFYYYPADSLKWIKYSDTIIIPDSISFMNVSIEALNDLNSDVKISGMSLTTAGPLVVDFFSTQVCAGDSTVLTSSSSPADSIQSLLWDLDGDGKFDDAEGSVVTHLFKGAGLYGVGLKGITYHGKTKAIYKEVIVAGVKVDFSVDNGCTGMNSDFRDNSTLIGDFPVAYFWDFGDGTPGSDLTNPTHTYNSQGSYPVKHRVRTMGGCSDSITKMVLIAAPPLLELTFTGDTIFAEGDSVIASVSGDYDKVVWSDSSKGSWIVIRTSGKWWVRGYKNKCYSEESFSTLEKEYGPEPVAMTVFTPNNDGFNDVWKILNISKIGPCEVEIYDRWGIKVYSSKDYNNNWDGSYNGNRLGNDTYYFFIHTTDGHLYKGTVSIVK